MSAREQYLHEQRVKAERPIGRDPWPDDELPSWGSILAGLAFMAALALGLWLLPFVVAALRGLP
jgi:hypothetical protein